MPLPLILGIVAGVGAVTGVGSGIHGAVKMKDANDTMKSAKSIMEESQKKFEKQNEATTSIMDELGQFELTILESFKMFSDVIEKIQNRPQMKEIEIDGIKIPEYNAEKLNEASVGAGVLLGGLGGAAAGTAGGFAAAGATTAAVMALGTASTGTAIASLSGAAATNATLAALGGGAIAAGGGGIALGTTMLGLSTAGIGLLVGGVIFNITGSKLSDKADEAYRQAGEARAKVKRICSYLVELEIAAEDFKEQLNKINEIYGLYFNKLRTIISVDGKTDWNLFTSAEKRVTENTILLVGLLYKMCQVKLVEQANTEDEFNSVNNDEIASALSDAKQIYDKVA
ncbi:MAG: hypothetical protein NC253_15240 [Ruminococcus sp.]|nr:hypothetical protein [Ruminococcus sp.]MCM1480418.1 hypothetical protein [Muribaculaceae bacterium]